MHPTIRPHRKRRVVRIVAACLALIPATVLAASATSPRDAFAQQTERVVVFELETLPLTTFEDTQKCNNAPLNAHTIVNLTSKSVWLYADDRCENRLFEVQPNFGSHVAPRQSFSAN